MADLPACKTLKLHVQESRLYIVLNRPEARNALSAEMVTELGSVAHAIEHDRSIRTVILRGAGGFFCAGGDIKGFRDSFTTPPPKAGAKDPIAHENRTFGTFLTKFNNLPQTVVGVIEGAAFGGGMGLVCVTDVALSMSDTHFALSETSLGIPPAQIAPFVVQRVGITNARRLALTGARFRGGYAKEIGLVHFIAENQDDLEEMLRAVLNDIGRCAPRANAATKRILLDSLTKPLHDVLDDAADAFAAQLRGHEGPEGVKAFIEKREAHWVEHVDG